VSRIRAGWWLAVGLWALPLPARADCEWDFGIQVGNDCGAITAEGCCKDGAYRYWCDGGILCMEECFFADCGYVAFLGYQCGTLMGVGADSCPAIPAPCIADCLGRECGDDGCGGSCGTCGGFGTCVQGRCQSACQPSCSGRECGDDGCGGSCGSCSGGRTCRDGVCAAPDCTPDCAGRECGENGCGGVCGTCQEGFLCKEGRCEAPQVCHPACEGKECGPDGCDGVCGVCPRGMVCGAQGTCLEEGQSCVPLCQGRTCGDDGCGGLCGVCEAPAVCRAGRCEEPAGEDDGNSSPSSDTGVPGNPGGDPGDGTGTLRCPEGQQLIYGTCVAAPREASTGGGCGSGPTPASFGWLPWVLAAIGLVDRARRRRPGR